MCSYHDNQAANNWAETNPAMTLQLHSEDQWRGVVYLDRWA